jgi:hypothetical protein
VNGDGYESSRKKSKSERRHREDDEERIRDKEKEYTKYSGGRRSSRYDEDYEYDSKDRSNGSSRHGRSSRDERHRDRSDREKEKEKDKQRPVLEEPQDDIGFKIKGTKSASLGLGLDTSPSSAMAPPPSRGDRRGSRRSSAQHSTPNTPASAVVATPTDPYAEERERRQRERLDRENLLRRGSGSSLGKRMSRDGDGEVDEEGGKGGIGGGKKARRKVNYRYEDEVELADGGGDPGRGRRWRS